MPKFNKPILAGLLALLLFSLPFGFAQSADEISLPDLGEPALNSASVQPNISAQGAGFTYHDSSNGKRITLTPQYTTDNGTTIGGSFAGPLAKSMAVGVLLSVGSDKNEWLLNTGFDLSSNQRFIFSVGQLRQKQNFNFNSSDTQKTQIRQNNVAASYQYYLAKNWLNAAEVDAYISNTNSVNLSDKTYFTDTTSLYELWSDPRRIAGGRVSGVQGRLVFTPTAQSNLKLGFGGERLEYDLLSGNDRATRATGSAEFNQRLDQGFNFRASVNAGAAQNRYALGLAKSFKDAQLGIDVATIQGRNNTFNDQQVMLSYTQSFGSNASTPLNLTSNTDQNLNQTPNQTPNPVDAAGAPIHSPAMNTTATDDTATPWASSLVDQVARRPSFLPAQAVAKVDMTTTPTRLIAIDKMAVPVGSSINTVTGNLIAPTGTTVSVIAGITKNGAAFTNGGQFALSDSTNLVINPKLIAHPAVGITDTYIVTMGNSSGGGTTLATITVVHGSTHIISVVMSHRLAQTISFATLSAKVITDATFNLSATASSGLAVSFTSNSSSVCTLSGNTVILVAIGTCSITASQAGNAEYSAAASVTQTFSVNVMPTLTGFALSSSSVMLGATAPTITAPTSASSGAITYTSSNPAVATISGSIITIVGVGTTTFTATQAANGNYASATATASLTVTAVPIEAPVAPPVLPTQPTPTFSPVAGPIAFGSTVTIASANADAIYYTTNGADPTIASTNQATTALVINAGVTVKALAVRAGYPNSAIGTATYTQAMATAPAVITLAVGDAQPVGGVTNVTIPIAGDTDSTGAVTGWVTTTADKIKFTVTAGAAGTSTITINGGAYTSGAAYTIGAVGTLTIVVTTTEAGKTNAVRTFSVGVTGDYIIHGGLTWAPINTTVANWSAASSTCSSLSNAVFASGWRQATVTELLALRNDSLVVGTPVYPAGWGVLNGIPNAGFSTAGVWTSTVSAAPYANGNWHDYVALNLAAGGTGPAVNSIANAYTACVHP